MNTRRPLRLTRSLVIGMATLGAAGCGDQSRSPEPRAIEVSSVYIVLPAGDSPAALYATIRNTTTAGDTLRMIQVPGANPVMLHAPMPTMAMLSDLPVAAGTTERLAPGRRHGMIDGFRGPKRGDSVLVTFRFQSGRVPVVQAHVITYADVDTAAPPVR